MKHDSSREGVLQKSVEGYLALRRDVCWFMRTNPGDRMIRGLGRDYRIRGAPAGTADIVGCARGGRFFGIELKRPGGKARPTQHMWAERIRSLGGAALLAATSIGEVAEFLDSIVKGET